MFLLFTKIFLFYTRPHHTYKPDHQTHRCRLCTRSDRDVQSLVYRAGPVGLVLRTTETRHSTSVPRFSDPPPTPLCESPVLRLTRDYKSSRPPRVSPHPILVTSSPGEIRLVCFRLREGSEVVGLRTGLRGGSYRPLGAAGKALCRGHIKLTRRNEMFVSSCRWKTEGWWGNPTLTPPRGWKEMRVRRGKLGSK